MNERQGAKTAHNETKAWSHGGGTSWSRATQIKHYTIRANCELGNVVAAPHPQRRSAEGLTLGRSSTAQGFQAVLSEAVVLSCLSHTHTHTPAVHEDRTPVRILS